ncbi:MAG: preprotein translocase subunit SecD [Methanomicrobiaceae archaeon]|nr:preprotein translocase subunit SecD [Methanomicrobiaceae archaeon]
MSSDTFRAIFSDWRIILMTVLVVFSLASIYLVPFSPEKGVAGNLQLGLDLEGGAWIQLGFDAEVVRFATDRDPASFAADLDARLDGEVLLIDDDRLEIRKSYTREELEAAFEAAGGTVVAYEQGVSESTASDIKRILEDKINSLGTRDARVNTISGMSGVTRYIRIEIAGADIATAQDVVGQQGKFEIRIQTVGNATEHVLFGDAITSVSTPSREPGTTLWGVGFTLNEEGAQAFRQAALTYGAVDNPEAHDLIMLLDDEVVYSAPLSPELAGDLRTSTVRSLSASTGAGDAGLEEAKNLEIHLRAGALPVDVSIAGSGSVSAALGEHFKTMSILAGLFALLAVAVVVYYRYREPLIVLPMIGTNIAEIIILLGIARYIQQLDLAAIAGIIAVLGTGIDQLVVITDEVLHEGGIPSPNLYQKRLGRALGIIVVAASTTIIAMLPLALMDLSSLRGFAIVTILGVLIGVVITRPAYGKIIMALLSR